MGVYSEFFFIFDMSSDYKFNAKAVYNNALFYL